MSVLSHWLYGGQPAPSLPQSSPQLQDVAQFAQGWLEEPMPVTFSGVTPEPTFWERLTGPWENFGQSLWTGVGETAERFYQRVPEMLFGWGAEKFGLTEGTVERTVREGPDRTVTYTQPKYPGGTPAQGPLFILPGQIGQGLTGMLPAQVREGLGPNAGILIALGVGLVVILLVIKK